MKRTKLMRDVYAETVSDIAQNFENTVVLEADLSSSISTQNLKEIIKERYINVGIMEGELIGVASGLASVGFVPFIHTFAPFASRRPYDQLFLALGYSGKHAVIVGSDAGVSTEMNGGTHMCFEDMALMRAIPKCQVFDVADDKIFETVLRSCFQNQKLNYIRTARKDLAKLKRIETNIDKGYSILREGSDVVILACGILVEEAFRAAEELSNKGIESTVIDVFRIKPLDQEMILHYCKDRPVVTAENHNVIGGLGSAVSEILSEHAPSLMKVYGLTSEKIIEEVISLTR